MKTAAKSANDTRSAPRNVTREGKDRACATRQS
jgi:hypothetical protein